MVAQMAIHVQCIRYSFKVNNIKICLYTYRTMGIKQIFFGEGIKKTIFIAEILMQVG